MIERGWKRGSGRIGGSQRGRSIVVAVLACGSLLVTGFGCSRDSGDSTAPKSETTATGSSTVDTPPAPPDPTKTGRVTGRVVFDGEVPAPQPIRMSADPYCERVNGGTATRQTIEVGKDGGLRNVFVYVKDGLGDVRYPTPNAPAVLDQVRCGYTPTLLGLQVGQPLTIRNSDSTLHNVHALPENSSGFNVGMPTKGMTSTRKFAEPEVLVRIKCDVHPWMEAYVGVVSHPFFAVTHVSGSYDLAGLPPGRYTIEAVHPKLGAKSADATVTVGEATTVDFAFSR